VPGDSLRFCVKQNLSSVDLQTKEGSRKDAKRRKERKDFSISGLSKFKGKHLNS
jgi:hypothetical protein